jgi:hypothetical protein
MTTNTNARPALTAEDLRDAYLEHSERTGVTASIKTIAEMLDRPTGEVHAAFSEAAAADPRIWIDRDLTLGWLVTYAV